MKAQKLTPKEKEIFEVLTSIPGGVLFKHIKPTGLVCYRVLDAKRNPIMNVRQGIVDNLVDKDVLEKNGFDFILKASTESKMDMRNLGLVKTA